MKGAKNEIGKVASPQCVIIRLKVIRCIAGAFFYFVCLLISAILQRGTALHRNTPPTGVFYDGICFEGSKFYPSTKYLEISTKYFEISTYELIISTSNLEISTRFLENPT